MPPWLSIVHSTSPGGSLGSKVLTVKLRSRPTMAAVSRCEESFSSRSTSWSIRWLRRPCR